MIRRLFSSTRYLLLIPVLGALVSSMAILIFGAVETYQTIVSMLDGSLLLESPKPLLLKFIEIIDLFLIGTVFYITALGLYELFIDEKVPTPTWLHIDHLDDLKSKLLGVIIVILVVVFLAQVINWSGGLDILGLGTGMAIVIAAVTYFLRVGGNDHK